jgi:NADH dehydrogenase
MSEQPEIVIVGAGFGGLFAAQALRNKPVDVVLIDRNNFHTFTPLLYQVATCALDPSEITKPVRSIFRKSRNIKFLLGEVTDVSLSENRITVQAAGSSHPIEYDYLILSGGSESNYFGNQQIEAFSFDLKSLGDAVDLRNHALRQFERAVWTEDPEEQESLLTFVVVGGGPTGIETAGALYELYNHVLDREFSGGELKARVVLVEMLDHLLRGYPSGLRQSARKQLEGLGVEVRLGTPVAEVEAGKVTLGDGTVIPTHTLVWSAGVRGTKLANLLGVDLTRANLVPVQPTLQLADFPNAYCVGDMCYLEDEHGDPYPQTIPPAQQQARLAAANIMAELNGQPLDTFRFHDRGSMATIGRSRAVAWIYKRIGMSGFLAWIAWLFLHLISLVGFRNRLNVFVNWIWNYLTYDRSVRLILEKSENKQQTE